MNLTRSTWARLLTLSQEVSRRGEQISRRKIIDALSVCEHDARFLIDALKYKDIISVNPESINVDSGTKEIFLCDIHFPFQDDAALGAALEYADRFQPDIITLGGDTIDFYKISRYVTNPVKRNVIYEIKVVREFLAMLRKRFPKARIIFLNGNHSLRLDNYLMSQAKEIYSLISDLLEVKLDFAGQNIEYKAEPFSIGKLWHLHGHEKGGGMYNPEHVCNVMFGYVLDHFICGHYHRTQDKIFKRIDKSIFLGSSVGYLAGEMDYARLNKWNQGFASIIYGENGRFRVRNHKIFNGEIF